MIGPRTAEQPREITASSAPRPVVLIADVDNQTGDPAFEAVGAGPIAELSRARMLATTPDAVAGQLRPSSSPMPGALRLGSLGFDAAVRQGVSLVVQTQSRKNDRGGFELESTLLNPRDGRPIFTKLDEASDREAKPTFIARHANRLVGQINSRNPEGLFQDVSIEFATTASIKAFQLYAESYRLGRLGNPKAALGPAREAVTVDPNFASGWTWLAWMVRNAAIRELPFERQPGAQLDAVGSGAECRHRSRGRHPCRARRVAGGVGPPMERHRTMPPPFVATTLPR